MPRKKESPAMSFLELVGEVESHRAEMLEDIVGLVEAKAWSQVKHYYKNYSLSQFLTDAEISFLKILAIRNGADEDILN